MDERARKLLKGWLSESARIERPPGTGSSGPDLVVRDGGATLAIELKRIGDPGWLAGAVVQAREAARRVARDAVPVVGVPYMSDVGRELCRDAGVSWFDFSGNADIRSRGLRIYVEGKANAFKRPGRPSTVFAPRSSRIARWLLLEPERVFKQRDLAAQSNLDEGFTSRIVKKLEADRLVRRDRGGLRLVDPNLLLDAWREKYDFSKHLIVRGHVTSQSGQEALSRVAEAFQRHKVSFAATGLGAAWLLTQFAMFRLSTLFVPEIPTASVLKSAGFRRETRGANVWLVVPDDDGVFTGSTEHAGIRTVHPVQAYLDLKSHPERSAEAAAELRKRLIRWKA